MYNFFKEKRDICSGPLKYCGNVCYESSMLKDTQISSHIYKKKIRIIIII